MGAPQRLFLSDSDPVKEVSGEPPLECCGSGPEGRSRKIKSWSLLGRGSRRGATFRCSCFNLLEAWQHPPEYLHVAETVWGNGVRIWARYRREARMPMPPGAIRPQPGARVGSGQIVGGDPGEANHWRPALASLLSPIINGVSCRYKLASGSLLFGIGSGHRVPDRAGGKFSGLPQRGGGGACSPERAGC